MARHTLGLAMIMKNEVEDLDRIVKDYGKFFDKIYVTVTDKKTYTALLKSDTANLVDLSYFKWIDHFGKARNYNLNQVKTDYWMWLDLDDDIEGAENLAQVIDHMVTNDLDVVWIQYDAVRRVDTSESGSTLWRERIIKTASKLEWRNVAIHETLGIEKEIKQEFLPQVIIKHRKTIEQLSESWERNRAILERDWQRSHGVETAWYQSLDLMQLGDYEGAIEKLLFVARHGKIKLLRFEVWQNLCECYLQMGQYDAALAATNEANAIVPDHPRPWYQRFSIYMAMGHPGPALEAAEIAMSKRIQGNQLISTQDPSWYQYKGPFTVARAYLSIGNVERAYQLYSEVKRIAPQYIEEQSKAAGIEWDAVFEQAYNDKLSADQIFKNVG